MENFRRNLEKYSNKNPLKCKNIENYIIEKIEA